MEFIVVQQIHLAYGTEVLSKNGTKLVKFTTTEKICRAERSTQKNYIDEERDDSSKNHKTKALIYQIM